MDAQYGRPAASKSFATLRITLRRSLGIRIRTTLVHRLKFFIFSSLWPFWLMLGEHGHGQRWRRPHSWSTHEIFPPSALGRDRGTSLLHNRDRQVLWGGPGGLCHTRRTRTRAVRPRSCNAAVQTETSPRLGRRVKIHNLTSPKGQMLNGHVDRVHYLAGEHAAKIEAKKRMHYLAGEHAAKIGDYDASERRPRSSRGKAASLRAERSWLDACLGQQRARPDLSPAAPT